MNVMTGMVITLFEFIIIFWQIHLIVTQSKKNNTMVQENDKWKTSIESLYSNDIKEIIEQNKKLLNAFNDLIINNKN